MKRNLFLLWVEVILIKYEDYNISIYLFMSVERI